MPAPSHRRSRAVLEDIEPRILYAADHPAAAALGPLLMADTTQVTQVTQIAQIAQMPAETHSQAQSQGATELVFIDERVPDADRLAQDIVAQAAAGRDIEVLRIGADEDGIAAITRGLASHDGIAAVHVVAHGSAGAVQLGTSTLDQSALLLRAPEIAAWGTHLSTDADMLLYGCDVADGDQGQALLQGLAQLTGADVAASTDLTGAADRGGNWLLEARTGTIEAAVAVDLRGQAAFHGVLATFTVVNTNDSGAGSFRQAILDANAGVGADTVNFAIGGFNTRQTIVVASALPTLTGSTAVNGFSQGLAGAHNIIIDGNNGNYDGLALAAGASGSSISGLVIRNFGQEGIQIDANSNDNLIQGNYIGQLDADGLAGPAGSGNRTGILVLTGATGNMLGGSTAAQRNVISGNDGAGAFDGVGIDVNAAANTSIQGNYIGTDASGNVALGNVNAGILVRGAGSNTSIGGYASGEPNVIAGNLVHNVLITGTGAVGTVFMTGNSIGLAADGVSVLHNSLDGIHVEGTVNGGNFTSNVIAGAGRNGIRIDGTVTNLFIYANRIGTDAAGTADWGSGQDGLFIGNTTGNGAGPSNGVFIQNTIAFSGHAGPNYAGVRIDASVTGANSLLANTIYASSGLGIDIGALGVQANDLGDVDAGANDLQNYPLLNLAALAGGQINLSISLNSSPSTTFTIEFFGVPAGSLDGSGHGEARVQLGSIDVTTDASGNVAATTSVAAGSLVLGDRLTATATRHFGGGSFGGTSEFSANAVVISLDPVITSDGGGASASVSVAEGSTAVTTVTATDADSPTLAYSIAGGADAARFTIDTNTGVLSFAAAPNFEAPADADANNVYDVVVRASDGSHTDTQAIAVTVTDVNESPIGPVGDIDTAANGVAENAANGSTVGVTAHAVDPDGVNNTVSYRLTNDAGGRFAIDAGTGVVTVADGTRLDFEAAASHAITALATSADGSTSSQSFTIALANVNDDPPRNTAPVITSDGGGSSAAISVAEGTRDITTVVATDAEQAASALGYAILGGADAARFVIDANTGVLRFVGTPVFGQPGDADGDNVYQVVVGASDGLASDTQSLTVRVTAAPETPVAPVDPPSPPSPPPSPPSPPPAPPVVPIDPFTPVPPVVPVTPTPPLTPEIPVPGPGNDAPFVSIKSDVVAPVELLPDTPTGDDRGATPFIGRWLRPIEPERDGYRVAMGGFAQLFAESDVFQLTPRAADGPRQGPAPVHGLTAADERDPSVDAAASSDVDVVLVSSVAFSLGLVFWASRAGALLASLLAATPAWQNFDPLPVLRRRGEGRDLRDPETQAEPETLVPSETVADPAEALPGEGLASMRRIGADGAIEARP